MSVPNWGARMRKNRLSSGATRMVIETRFPSREAMDQMVEMGMEEGITAAIGQIDAILATA